MSEVIAHVFELKTALKLDMPHDAKTVLKIDIPHDAQLWKESRVIL